MLTSSLIGEKMLKLFSDWWEKVDLFSDWWENIDLFLDCLKKCWSVLWLVRKCWSLLWLVRKCWSLLWLVKKCWTLLWLVRKRWSLLWLVKKCWTLLWLDDWMLLSSIIFPNFVKLGLTFLFFINCFYICSSLRGHSHVRSSQTFGSGEVKLVQYGRKLAKN